MKYAKSDDAKTVNDYLHDLILAGVNVPLCVRRAGERLAEPLTLRDNFRKVGKK